jgi:hypothetical protein
MLLHSPKIFVTDSSLLTVVLGSPRQRLFSLHATAAPFLRRSTVPVAIYEFALFLLGSFKLTLAAPTAYASSPCVQSCKQRRRVV